MKGDKTPFDPITKAAHYNSHPSGVEAIDISRHLTGNIAQAFQYLYRWRYKGEGARDLRKACYFLRDQARHLGPAGDQLPDVALSYAIEVIEGEEDHRLREALRVCVVGLNTSQYERAAQLIEQVINEIEG